MMEGEVRENLVQYLSRISSYPLLSPEEERRLAILYYEHGDEGAGKRLITSNLRFVVKVALEYRGYGIKLLDLIQEGNLGLIVALKHFDPYKGYRFISYAIWWIRAYIQNYIMKSWSLVKVGTTQAQKKLFYKMGKIKDISFDEEAREEKLHNLASELEIDEEEIERMAERFTSRDLSLDAPVGDEQETTFLDFLVDLTPNQEEALAEKERRDFLQREVRRALEKLNGRERVIIERRIMAEEPATLQELGDLFKISRERVRQIEGGALRKLRKELQGNEELWGEA
ncbi:MAG: RNA polymerase subunit sigma-70 [Deltaproteobacteria bacterium]|nr:MAG: RNA polymerase subunit sigma-70 [Deltaproteobacteria bacterium]RLA98746.1 MAG: RNA polymerase subunit sigma-70 [Deltaproteobacteria bacterium]